MNPTTVSDVLVQEITINAPVDRVFEALTDPHERMKWWGSEGRFQVRQYESDLQPGGKWAMRGIGIGGKPFVVTGEYREIERPNLLVFTGFPIGTTTRQNPSCDGNCTRIMALLSFV